MLNDPERQAVLNGLFDEHDEELNTCKLVSSQQYQAYIVHKRIACEMNRYTMYLPSGVMRGPLVPANW